MESGTGSFNDCKGRGFGIFFSVLSKRQNNKLRKKKLSKKKANLCKVMEYVNPTLKW